MIVKVKLKDRTMLFGNSNHPWYEHFKEWFSKNQDAKLVSVMVSNESWIKGNDLQWCHEESIQKELNCEHSLDGDSTKINRRYYRDFKFFQERRITHKVLKIMGISQKEWRLQVINNLLHFISKIGRRFFYRPKTRHGKTNNVARMIIKNGHVYYVDDYTEELVSTNVRSNWQGFSRGGTLRALIAEFAYFVRSGRCCNGREGYGGLFSDDWGHSEQEHKRIISYAREIGYLPYTERKVFR